MYRADSDSLAVRHVVAEPYMQLSCSEIGLGPTTGNYLRPGMRLKEAMFCGLCVCVCLSVCVQNISKSYRRILMKVLELMGRGLLEERSI